MAGTERTDKLTGFEALGLLAGTRRAGDWSGPLPELTGLSVDSRETRPGHLFAALPGSRVHGAEFIPYALRMGRGGGPDRCRRAGAGRGRARAARGAGRRSRTIPGARWRSRRRAGSARSPRCGRRDGHQRQDLGRELHPADLGGAGRGGGQPRHDRGRGRGGGAAEPHDAGADGAAPAAGRTRRQGRDPCGDGGVEPRARPAPAGRGAAGGGGVHQLHPRPPGLPRGLRGVLRRQARAVRARAAAAGRRRSSTSTIRTGRGCGGSRERARPAAADRRPGRGLRRCG